MDSKQVDKVQLKQVDKAFFEKKIVSSMHYVYSYLVAKKFVLLNR